VSSPLTITRNPPASSSSNGVLSYSVAERTHELGIRMALGARARAVLLLVIGQGMRLALIGVALGLIGALALTRLMDGLLFGVSPTDPLTLGAIAVLLMAVALLAGYFPARRADARGPNDRAAMRLKMVAHQPSFSEE
jgi:ABC-type antimicrobial peptide transport system permease subunit